MIHEVEENRVLCHTYKYQCRAWRYLIGDTIRFVDIEKKMRLSSPEEPNIFKPGGEHLSVDKHE